MSSTLSRRGTPRRPDPIHPNTRRGTVRRPFPTQYIAVTLLILCGCSGPKASDTTNVAADIAKGKELASAGKIQDAINALRRAESADPNALEPHVLLADLLSKTGKRAEARDEALAAHKLKPDDPQLTFDVLQRTPESFEPAEVEKLAREAIAQNPESPIGHQVLGSAIANAGDPKRYPEAIKELREAYRLDSSLTEAIVEMGRVYYLSGDYASAEAMLGNAKKVLEQRAAGRMSPPEIEDWLKMRRAAAYWTAQVYRRTGKADQSSQALTESALWSERSRELKTLRDRAGAVPPDMEARARLDAIARIGISYWKR